MAIDKKLIEQLLTDYQKAPRDIIGEKRFPAQNNSPKAIPGKRALASRN
jgi:hypothetical protein